MRIEAVFGGILALFVLGVAIYAIITGTRRSDGPINPGEGYETPVQTPIAGSTRDAALCGCFSEGFDLAASNVGVMSAQYRTGFEVCRTQLGEQGGCAFTAGWNARLSARPFESSCRTFLKRPADAC
ncbi:MAG: hypothetical protein ABL957_16290 [Parvularculaceae bacterium]